MSANFLRDFVPLHTKMGIQPGEECEDCKRDWRKYPVVHEVWNASVPQHRDTGRGVKLCRECAVERRADLEKGYSPRAVGFHLPSVISLRAYFGEGSCVDCDHVHLRGEFVGAMVPPDVPRGFRMLVCSRCENERIQDYENDRQVRRVGTYKYRLETKLDSAAHTRA